MTRKNVCNHGLQSPPWRPSHLAVHVRGRLALILCHTLELIHTDLLVLDKKTPDNDQKQDSCLLSSMAGPLPVNGGCQETNLYAPLFPITCCLMGVLIMTFFRSGNAVRRARQAEGGMTWI